MFFIGDWYDGVVFLYNQLVKAKLFFILKGGIPIQDLLGNSMHRISDLRHNRGPTIESHSEGLGIFLDQILRDQDGFAKTLFQIFEKRSFLSRTISDSKTPFEFFHEKDTNRGVP